MNQISRFLSGGIMVLVGTILFFIFFNSENNSWSLFVYGLILFIIGIFILLNKNEDKIEGIKEINNKISKRR